MSILATCATLAALLASAQGGETVNLAKGSTCGEVKVTKVYPRQVTVNAGGSTVRGLRVIGGGNIRWRSGRIEAPAGAFGFAAGGYGIQLVDAQRVVIDGVLVTAAKKGIVIAGGRALKVQRSRFFGVGEDGIIASRVMGLVVFGNRFAKTVTKPSQCNVEGTITFNVPQRDCRPPAVWTDGTHADAVQMRDGVTDATIANNVVRGKTAGITQMDTTGDAPLVRVLVSGNDIETDDYNRLTLDQCLDCWIKGNSVRRAPGSTKRAVIIAGLATRCGNIAPDDRVIDAPCPGI